ncbi:hypothetical protein [Marinomonas sp. TW1]|uniref:hypothetical protein n=1 Tax=Marinomonas sp. TW1 TaxID=1561203 RepID=UPI0012E91ADA|nr:hypothetical protein [Marinomonas sp. TW1]
MMDLTSLKQKSHKHIRGISLFIIGVVSAAIIPIWQVYFVEQSDLSVELAEIKRLNSNHFEVTLATDELKLLTPYIDEERFYEYNNNGQRGDKIRYPSFSVNTLHNAFEKAKLDLKNIAETKALLMQHMHTIDQYLDPENEVNLLTEFRVAEMKEWSLRNYIDDDEAQHYLQQVLSITRNYTSMEFKDREIPTINTPALVFLLSDVKEDLYDVIVSNNRRLEKLRDNMRGIETQIQKLQLEQSHLYSYFNLDVVVTNNGRISASLRPVALVRVNISDNNYVDLRLQMQEYQRQAEIEPASTQIIHYRTKILSSYPIEDRKLMNTFWGTTGRARLLTLDTRNNIYISNEMAFADSSNQKVMFDRLKERASSL